ncbi:MAG: DUF1800 family protein, partial [Rhodothermales bacterium]
LKSEAFFDSRSKGARIKSPVETTIGLMNSAAIDPGANGMSLLNRSLSRLSQQLLNPPNVAGWPGHRTWIDTTTLPLRWIAADLLIGGRAGVFGADVYTLAANLSDPSWDSGEQRLSPFYLPLAIAEHLLPIPLENASVEEVTEDFAGDLDTFPIPEEVLAWPSHLKSLVKIFLAGAPWYEWNLADPGSSTLLEAFMRYVVKLPEFELT